MSFPHDFGTMATATIFIEVVTAFTDLGMGAAIIKFKKLEKEHLSTAFWSNLMVGITLCIVGIISAPYLAIFFKNEDLRDVMKVLSLGFIIGSLAMVHTVQLTRSLDFKINGIAQVGGTVCFGLISIPMVLMGFGVWSLVWGTLGSRLFIIVTIWLVVPWRPSFEFSSRHFKELFGFGAYTLGTTIMSSICLNVDIFIIGRYLGSTSLGLYLAALNLSTLPVRKVASTIRSVTFPSFSRVQDDDEMIRRVHLKNISYISLVSFPLLAGLSVVSHDFIRVVYGQKWIGAAVPLQFLCWAGLLRTITISFGTIYQVKGKPDIDFKIQIARFIFLTVAILGLFRYGFIGISIGILIATFFVFVVSQYFVNQMIGLTYKVFWRTLRPVIVGTLSIVVTVGIYRYAMVQYLSMGHAFRLFSSVIVGAMAYSLSLWFTKSDLVGELTELVVSTVRSMIHRAFRQDPETSKGL